MQPIVQDQEDHMVLKGPPRSTKSTCEEKENRCRSFVFGVEALFNCWGEDHAPRSTGYEPNV